MTSNFVFCTANLGPDIVDTFVRQSTRPRGSNPRQWILVKSPNEPIKGPPLSSAQEWFPEQFSDWPVVPATEPFDTGFFNAPVETLFEFVLGHAKVEAGDEVPFTLQFSISTESFAVLDSRSAEDGTALIYHYHTRMPPEELLEDEDAYDEEKLIHEWVEWRVNFITAGFWVMAYESMTDYTDFEISSAQYIDEHGVLQIAWFERDDYSIPGLTEDERAPLGPDKVVPEWRFPESSWVDLVDAGTIKVYSAQRKSYE